MPTFASKLSIPASGDATAQAQTLYSAIVTALDSAGFTRIVDIPFSLPDRNAIIYRFPQLDEHHSYADFLLVARDPNNFLAKRIYDYDIGQALASETDALGSDGGWSGGTWPSTGSPIVGAITSTAFNDFIVAFSPGTDAWTIRIVASEYGLFVASDDGNTTELGMSLRGMDDLQGVREMQFQATDTFPLTFASAPSGPAHMTITVEGVNFNVTFPTGVALSAYRIAQAITMQCGGMAEAYVAELLTGDFVRVRIPPTRAPVGNYSTEKPQLALTYLDPNCVLDFSLFRGAADALGASSIRVDGQNWATTNARPGGTVYNQTRNASLVIDRFTTDLTTYDTIVTTAAIPGTWAIGDTYVVLPGPENHAHGMGGHNGIYQAVLQSPSPTNILFAGSARTVILNDRYGEAQSKFEVGQTVLAANNGFAFILEMADASGYIVGEEITGTRGSIGVIRAKAGNDIIVDTVRGPNTVSYAGVPWAGGESLTGTESGHASTVSTIVSSDSSGNRAGWFTTVTVLAKGQVGSGDLRTTLTLDFGAVGINPSLELFPSFVVGSQAKNKLQLDLAQVGGSVFSLTTTPHPGGTYTTNMETDVDIRRNEVNALAAENPHDPDWETHSFELAELVVRYASPSKGGYQTIPHFRSVSARGAQPTNGDRIEEDGDSNRPWVALDVSSRPVGAGTGTSPNHWILIGPGGVA